MRISPHTFLVVTEGVLVLICTAVLFSFAPTTAHAATASKVIAKSKIEISGWIPYWRTATGTADVLPRLSQLTEVNPFGYTVKKDGSLFDAAKIKDGAWDALIKQAKAKKVRVIPTVMWSDTDSIDTILSDPKLRSKHVDAIVAMVIENNFDGVDIDYEGKRASNRDDYSAFLKELYTKMGKKWVMCTIEARTPPDSLYKVIPADLEYANDFKAINKYCDRVRLMTYDQQSADIKLNKAAKGLYTPVSDPAWVTKVVNLAAKDIAKSKIMIGIATYGYIYQVMPYDDGTGYSYDLMEAFNPKYGIDLAKSLGITPVRNSAGELSFTYIPAALSKTGLPSQSEVSAYAPAGTPSALLAAVGATQIAKAQSKQSPFYLLWWSDSKAIADKVALARKLGVRGVSVFKFDGGADPLMWQVLK
jgi:spore germination protein YaaH